MELTQKQKMLAVALFTRKIRKENTAAILMVLGSDDEIDDLVWYMGQHPQAMDEELVAVAYQLAKEAREKNGKS